MCDGQSVALGSEAPPSLFSGAFRRGIQKNSGHFYAPPRAGPGSKGARGGGGTQNGGSKEYLGGLGSDQAVTPTGWGVGSHPLCKEAKKRGNPTSCSMNTTPPAEEGFEHTTHPTNGLMLETLSYSGEIRSPQVHVTPHFHLCSKPSVQWTHPHRQSSWVAKIFQ